MENRREYLRIGGCVVTACIFFLLAIGCRTLALDYRLGNAVRLGRCAEVERLLAEGASANTVSPTRAQDIREWIESRVFPSRTHRVALLVLPFVAAGDERSSYPIAEMIQLLLNYGADPNVSLDGGATTLMLAQGSRDQPLVTKLIRCGANVNSKNIRGETPLMYAVMSGDCIGIHLLLLHGALPGARDRWGRSAMQLARYFGKTGSVKMLEAGRRTGSKKSPWRPKLHAGSIIRSVSKSKLLFGADLNEPNYSVNNYRDGR